MENVKALRAMLDEHPDLPVVCMVEQEVVADVNFGRWLGKIGEIHREKIWFGECGVYYYKQTGVDEDVINDPNCIYPEMELTEKRAKEVYDSLDWMDCLVINVDTH